MQSTASKSASATPIENKRTLDPALVTIWIISFVGIFSIAIFVPGSALYLLPKGIALLLVSGYFTWFFDFEKHAKIVVAKRMKEK